MNLKSLQTDLIALQGNAILFEAQHFNARKEALNFIALIEKLALDQPENKTLRALHDQAQELADRILVFNDVLFQQLRADVQAGAQGRLLRKLLVPFTTYTPENGGQPHYGYENLDVLIEGVLMPMPHPEPTLARTYGMARYEPTPVSVMLEMYDQVQFSEGDVFYDLGAGLGKVVMLVRLLAGVPCIGVEFEPAYCEYAGQRAADLGLSGVKFINSDARDVDYSDGTIFFLFNPFGGDIFRDVMENLHQVAQHHAITICSYGAATPPLAELTWLQVDDPGTVDEVCLAIFRSNLPFVEK